MARVVLGMLGLGTVGTGVVELLSKHRHLTLKKVAVKDVQKERDVKPNCPLTTDVNEIINDPEIEVLVEVMGGENPTVSYLEQAIKKRKHIVTANKEVLAKHGPRLFALAKEHGVAIFFEASVAGGVPLLSTIHKGLEANEIESVTGILNGTTNFILSKMEAGNSYASALKEAQELGFAEADPTADVDGFDVAYKLSVLAALGFGHFVKPDTIYKEGIRNITEEDMALAKEFGYRIKLLGTAARGGSNGNSGFDVRVHPTLVPLDHPLASVSGPNNGILVRGHAVGQLTLIGPGAGKLPTASAVVGDLMNLAGALKLPDFASYFQPAIDASPASAAPPDSWKCPFYLRLVVKDTPGVIGKLGTIFGAHNISISTIIQRGVEGQAATVVILTHDVLGKDMNAAIAELKKSDFLASKDEIGNAIRIFRAA
ncbi:MAG: homoserine dehydrogenase [Candidatus Melainabacteria bacterium]|jgi:homoserine dehydrogenase|nr:homoserine dehydrogenase [Candidatus Melainabacteria bacterium]